MSNEREIKKERKKERRKERIGKKGIKEEKTRCRSDDFRAKDRAVVVSERRERKREEYRALVVVNNAL